MHVAPDSSSVYLTCQQDCHASSSQRSGDHPLSSYHGLGIDGEASDVTGWCDALSIRLQQSRRGACLTALLAQAIAWRTDVKLLDSSSDTGAFVCTFSIFACKLMHVVGRKQWESLDRSSHKAGSRKQIVIGRLHITPGHLHYIATSNLAKIMAIVS